MGSSLFISYSHVDQAWMQAVQKHLRGTLMDRCRVWTDEDIPAGSTWEDVLVGQLKQASAGLVLASPDYLVSPWCRRELKALLAALKSGRLVSVQWVQLRPCGWNWTELADLQALQEPASAALEDLPEGAAREAAVLQVCRRITEAMLQITRGEDHELAMVRELLGRHPEGQDYRPRTTLKRGDFSIVCRGLDDGGDEVVIKVLTNTPLHRLRELFLQVSQARQTVVHPAVVKVDKVFEVGTDFEARIVIVSELAARSTLADLMASDADRPPAERVLQPDLVGKILRNLAEALAALHRLPEIHSRAVGQEGYSHLLGPLLPGNVYYDHRTGLPQISLVGVTNFLWHFFDADTFQRIVHPKSGTYLAPEKLAQRQVDHRADQYFLGMLAVELLELERLFAVPHGAALPSPQELLDRVRHSSARWTRHEQLRELLCRLLQPDPDDRFDSMEQVVQQWAALEEPHRVLAKYAFRRWIEPDGRADAGLAFSRRFYAHFFEADEGVRDIFGHAAQQRNPSAAADALTLDIAHLRKLVDSLRSVLNYRGGNAPSSIDSLMPVHHHRGILPAHFKAFTDSFIATLREAWAAEAAAAGSTAESAIPPIDPVEAEAIVQAWLALFTPAMDEMKRRLRP
jgi:serine/threonine protein kinase